MKLSQSFESLHLDSEDENIMVVDITFDDPTSADELAALIDKALDIKNKGKAKETPREQQRSRRLKKTKAANNNNKNDDDDDFEVIEIFDYESDCDSVDLKILNGNPWAPLRDWEGPNIPRERTPTPRPSKYQPLRRPFKAVV